MLTAMEIPVTAGPWLALGVVLGILLPALAALAVMGLRRRRAPHPSAPPPPTDPGVDDLPGFLDFPPGSAPSRDVTPTAWPALSASPAPAAAPLPEPVEEPDGAARSALVAIAVTALLLVGAAAAVAAVRTEDRPDRSSREPTRTTQPGDVSAELTFGGIVLERHAVGVTVAYPRVRVTVQDGRPAAELELPTFNCLRDSAPEHPETAGCSRSVPEYSQLAGTDLGVRADGDGFRITGTFPTYRRPNGSAEVATGRVYELAVDVAPRDGTLDQGSEPATGVLELGGERVGTSAKGTHEITYGG